MAQQLARTALVCRHWAHAARRADAAWAEAAQRLGVARELLAARGRAPRQAAAEAAAAKLWLWGKVPPIAWGCDGGRYPLLGVRAAPFVLIGQRSALTHSGGGGSKGGAGGGGGSSSRSIDGSAGLAPLAVAAGDDFFVVLTAGGRVLDSRSPLPVPLGRRADATLANEPGRASSPAGPTAAVAVAVAAGKAHALALRSDGAVEGWVCGGRGGGVAPLPMLGGGGDGGAMGPLQLDLGLSPLAEPAATDGASEGAEDSGGTGGGASGERVAAIASGAAHAAALTTRGRVLLAGCGGGGSTAGWSEAALGAGGNSALEAAAVACGANSTVSSGRNFAGPSLAVIKELLPRPPGVKHEHPTPPPSPS